MDWFVPAERPSVQTELLCFWNLGFIVLPSSVMWTIVQTTVDCMIKVTCTRHRAHLCRRLQADGFAHSLTTANISTKKKKEKKNPCPSWYQCLETYFILLKSAAELSESGLQQQSTSLALSFCDRLWSFSVPTGTFGGVLLWFIWGDNIDEEKWEGKHRQM